MKVPRNPKPVPLAKLEAVVALARPAPSATSTARAGSIPRLKVEEWLNARGVEYDKVREINKSRDKYTLNCCPFHGDHGGKDTAIFQNDDGAMWAKCFHDRCADKKWPDFKEQIGEPDPDHYDPPLGMQRNRIDAYVEARAFLREYWRENGTLTLHRWRGEYWKWTGVVWRPTSDEEIKAHVAKFLNSRGHSVTNTMTNNVVGCVQAECMLSVDVEYSCWLSGNGPWPADETLSTASGLIHPPSMPCDRRRRVEVQLLTPDFFSPNTLLYEFNARAKCPKWEKFLGNLWPGDQQSIDALQEWFGYCLLPDTQQHKILMVVGPPRSGKGTIARVLRNVVGRENTAAPTLSGLSSNFGLSPLLGKTVGTISDARLGNRSDIAQIVERLLSISGEDALTIDRKHKEPVTVQLTIRFVILTNELPRFQDVSGALAHRFVILQLITSWLGKEDTKLTDKLLTELPGILNWSIRGLQRLRERGHFIQPEAGCELAHQLQDLASPVGSFVRDWCATDPGDCVACDDLYVAYKQWCIQAGRDHTPTKQVFGRDLRTVLPNLGKPSQRRVEGKQVRFYQGIALEPGRQLKKRTI